jgi:glycosyltransferase involved in cell wall biosynthesis
MEAIVSVIIPVYNVEKYVAKCLDSIMKQTYKNLQIIIVDDGGKDGSVKICEEYAAHDARMLIVHKENGGLSSARNKGLEYATGKYCYFLDSDDYIESDTIEMCIKLMIQNNAQLIAFNKDTIDENGNIISTGRVSDHKYEIHSEEERMAFYLKNYYAYEICFEMWNKFYDLSIIQRHKLRFENNYKVFAEDICFNSYYLLYADTIVSTKKTLYHYLVREDSIMGQEKKKVKFKNFFYLLSKVEDFFKTNASDYMSKHFYMIVPVVMQFAYKRYKFYELPALLKQTQPSEEYDYYQKKLQEVLIHANETVEFYHRYLEDGYQKPDRMMRNTKMLSLQDHPLRQKIYILFSLISSVVRKKI